MSYSRHATVRSQQRAISPFMVDLLMQFGTRAPAGKGAERVYFDKRARRQLAAYTGPVAAALEAHLDIYAVVGDDDKVITVAHRDDRMQRDWRGC